MALGRTLLPKSPMRILISTCLFPNRLDDTRGIYILKQAVALKKHAEIRVVAPVPYVPSLARIKQYNMYTGIPVKDLIAGIDVTYPRFVVIPKVFRFLHGFFMTASLAKTYSEIIDEFRPDVILGFFAYPDGVANVRIARRCGLPVVIGVRGSDVNRMARSGLQRKIIAKALASSDKVLAVSSALRDEVLRLGVDERKAVVVTNGIDVEQFGDIGRADARSRLELGTNGKIVLCVTRLSEEKGVDILLEAFALFSEPDIRLVVVGEGVQMACLERRVGELGLHDRVRLAGRKPHSEIPLWMAAADLVVLPSRVEGHPNAILEALASGRPVVASRVGGVPEIMTSNGYGILVEPGDVAGLAQAIRMALNQEWDTEQILQRGRARSWDHVAEELLAEIESTVREFGAKG